MNIEIFSASEVISTGYVMTCVAGGFFYLTKADDAHAGIVRFQNN
jgi:hypothetical protein